MVAELEELLELERLGWQSLCDGSGSVFYSDIMTENGCMILAGGMVMSRSEVVDALRDAPPWSSFTIRSPRIRRLGPGAVALLYTGTGHRDEGDDFTAEMSSVYVRHQAGWKLELFQQTPIA